MESNSPGLVKYREARDMDSRVWEKAAVMLKEVEGDRKPNDPTTQNARKLGRYCIKWWDDVLALLPGCDDADELTVSCNNAVKAIQQLSTHLFGTENVCVVEVKEIQSYRDKLLAELTQKQTVSIKVGGKKVSVQTV